MTTEQSDGACTPSFSSDGLERFSFAELCELLPADVHWGDHLTPDILREVAMAVESRERNACKEACRKIAALYPTDIWPDDGQSLDCKSARMARLTAANCERQIDMRSNACSASHRTGLDGSMSACHAPIAARPGKK